MKIVGIAGWSGSGKTTLLIRLLPELISRGLTVSTIKHAHHAFDVDTPGKDSYAHREAGAHEAMVSSRNRWALMHEHRGAPETSLSDLLARLSPVDLVLVEGFKSFPHDKIEVYRKALGQSLLAETDSNIVAVASDVALPDIAVPRLDIDDVSGIAEFVVRHQRLEDLVA